MKCQVRRIAALLLFYSMSVCSLARSDKMYLFEVAPGEVQLVDPRTTPPAELAHLRDTALKHWEGPEQQMREFSRVMNGPKDPELIEYVGPRGEVVQQVDPRFADARLIENLNKRGLEVRKGTVQELREQRQKAEERKVEMQREREAAFKAKEEAEKKAAQEKKEKEEEKRWAEGQLRRIKEEDELKKREEETAQQEAERKRRMQEEEEQRRLRAQEEKREREKEVKIRNDEYIAELKERTSPENRRVKLVTPEINQVIDTVSRMRGQLSDEEINDYLKSVKKKVTPASYSAIEGVTSVPKTGGFFERGKAVIRKFFGKKSAG